MNGLILFLIEGRAPEPGDIWYSKKLASTLEELAQSQCISFYEGDIADKIDKYSREYGGFISKDDLKAYRPEWVEPISVNYKGYDIWELPPNTHGMVVLLALNILKKY